MSGDKIAVVQLTTMADESDQDLIRNIFECQGFDTDVSLHGEILVSEREH